MLSSWLAGCVGFYLVCCRLQFFLGILWSLPWHVSISTLYPAQTQSLCSDNYCGGSLVPVAFFPGSRWVVPAGTDHSRHRLSASSWQRATNTARATGRENTIRRAGTPVLPLFSHGPLFSHCADSGTQRQDGGTRKGVSNAMQLFHTSSRLSFCTSNKRGIKSSTQFSNKCNKHGACEQLATDLRRVRSSKAVPRVRM